MLALFQITLYCQNYFLFKIFIIYFVIRILVEKNIINFKTFLIFCSICSYFVCLDLIYQFNFGKDIFGFTQTIQEDWEGHLVMRW